MLAGLKGYYKCCPGFECCLHAHAGSEGEACKGAAADFAKLVSDLGPLAKFGELNATGLTPDALEERGIAAGQAADCKRSLILKPYGEQSEPDDPFPLYAGASSLPSGGNSLQGIILEHENLLTRGEFFGQRLQLTHAPEGNTCAFCESMCVICESMNVCMLEWICTAAGLQL